MIKLIIPGEPQGKQRARHTNKGFSYTPEKTVNYEALIKQTFQASGYKMLDGEIELTIFAYYSIPKSATKGKRLSMVHNITRPVKKPDIDNVCKIVADALNKLAYNDDSQIVKAVVEKFYTADQPRVEVYIQNRIAS